MTTTTHEGSIFEDPNTDVKPASDEQQASQVDDINKDDTLKGFDKFAMKTNNKLNATSQSLKDVSKLNSFLLRGKTAQEIREEDPEFARRLAKMDEYSDLFSDPEDETQMLEKVVSQTDTAAENQIEITEAISEIVVDGKRLSLGDRKLLQQDKNFMRVMNGFISAGFDPEDAAHRAFKERYPSKANMVETSFLSAPSERTVTKRETPEEKASKHFNDVSTYPPFLKKRMKK